MGIGLEGLLGALSLHRFLMQRWPQASSATQNRTAAPDGVPATTAFSFLTLLSRMVCETQLRPVQAGNSPLQQPEELSSGM